MSQETVRSMKTLSALGVGRTHSPTSSAFRAREESVAAARDDVINSISQKYAAAEQREQALLADLKVKNARILELQTVVNSASEEGAAGAQNYKREKALALANHTLKRELDKLKGEMVRMRAVQDDVSRTKQAMDLKMERLRRQSTEADTPSRSVCDSLPPSPQQLSLLRKQAVNAVPQAVASLRGGSGSAALGRSPVAEMQRRASIRLTTPLSTSIVGGATFMSPSTPSQYSPSGSGDETAK